MEKRLSFVGLGKLGICLASCFAEKDFEVIGVDIEESVVNNVNQGLAPWYEPGLGELLAKHGGKTFRATLHHEEAIEQSDITFILVSTPSNPDGSFSNRFIESALVSLARALRDSRKDHHLFVISSTVMPGSTNEIFIPVLEEHSGRKLNRGFSVCLDPDFVALGNVIKGFLQPDLVIIGESTPQAGTEVEAIHRQMCENQPTFSHMPIISAEIAKVCLNVYITTKISFANSVANLCECIPGADVDAITSAIGADRRISSYYLRGGPSFGGKCFPRDAKAYVTLANKYGVQADLMHAVDKVNQYQDSHLAESVLRELQKTENKTVGILGLAFTPNTPVVMESPAIKLIPELLKHDLPVLAYDPLAIDETRALFGSAIEYISSAEDCLSKAGLVVVTLRYPEFKEAVEKYKSQNGMVIIDCWRIIDPAKLDRQIKYVAWGRAQEIG